MVFNAVAFIDENQVGLELLIVNTSPDRYPVRSVLVRRREAMQQRAAALALSAGTAGRLKGAAFVWPLVSYMHTTV